MLINIVIKMSKNIYYVLFVLFIFVSCNKEKNLPISNTQEFVFTNNDSTNISVNKASEIASIFKYKVDFYTNKNQLKSASEYEIDNVIIIPDENEEPAMYVVNFSPKGYIIISATSKETPILGFSDEYSFDISNIPLGMAEWFYDRMHKIQIIRNDKNYKTPKEVTLDWKNFQNSSNLKSSNSNETIIEQYGPLLKTLWRQDVPYNDLVPKTGCVDYINNRAPTGCVTTAIAQVLKYHAYPSTKYNWKIMPNQLSPFDRGTNGAVEVAKLMRDIGAAIKTTYNCEGSGANTKEAVNLFKNIFNYSSGGIYAARSDEDAEILVKADLIASRPVIMDGYNDYYTYTTGWWLWEKTNHVYTNGHAWVCDGYKRINKSYTVNLLGITKEINIRNNYYHMNWGWGGLGQNSNDNNGWFLFSHINIRECSKKCVS